MAIGIITYEYLFELSRKEKTEEGITPLSHELFSSIREYIKIKKKVLEGPAFNSEMAIEEAKTFQNAQKLIYNIFIMRLDKIIRQRKIMKEEGLLEFEKDFLRKYNDLFNEVDNHIKELAQ